MAAREYAFPGSMRGGLGVVPGRVKILVPAIIEHYSIRSAMAWLSMGEDSVVRVPVDGKFRMIPEELDACIRRIRAADDYVLACVAYAGDSRSMCVDRLDVLANVLRLHNVWFHVDACHGSPAGLLQAPSQQAAWHRACRLGYH